MNWHPFFPVTGHLDGVGAGFMFSTSHHCKASGNLCGDDDVRQSLRRIDCIEKPGGVTQRDGKPLLQGFDQDDGKSEMSAPSIFKWLLNKDHPL